MDLNMLLRIILFSFFILAASAQIPCYVNCRANHCLPTNPLRCTDCDPGSSLVDGKCIPIGGQREPFKSFEAISQNALINETFSSFGQVRCNYNGEGNLTYYNFTRSTASVYVLDPIEVPLLNDHEYIQIKFNAIFFNPGARNNLQILIIDDQDRNIFEDQVSSTGQTPPSLNCFSDSGPRASSSPMYISISMSSPSQMIYIQTATNQPGDELGFSNIHVFTGKCHEECWTCTGPTNTECTSCSNFLFFNPADRTCQTCPEQFFKIGELCYACPQQCLECSYIVESSTYECIRCDQNLNTTKNCSYQGQIIPSLNGSISFEREDSNQWVSSETDTDLVTSCGLYELLGGVPSGIGGSTLSRNFTGLLAHQTVWVKFTLILIDQDPGTSYNLIVTIDGKEALNNTIQIDQSIQNSKVCAGEAQEFIKRINIYRHSHEGSNLNIQIEGSGPYFGIRDFVLGVDNQTSTPDCLKVGADGQCAQCARGLDRQNDCVGCSEGLGQAEGGICASCSIFCRTCEYSSVENPQMVCTSCDDPLSFDKKTGQCVDKDNTLYTTAISPYVESKTTDKWTFYPKIQNPTKEKCGEQFILGSSKLVYRTLSASRTFKDLPAHRGAIIHFFFYQIDDYDGVHDNLSDYTVTFRVDGNQYPYDVSSSGYQMCGNSTFDVKRKIVLKVPNHSASSLKFEIFANRVKFGINLFLLFLENCGKCENGVSQELEIIPVYSIDSPPEKGAKAKIIFQSPITSLAKNPNDIYSISLAGENLRQSQNDSGGQDSGSSGFFTGELGSGQFSDAMLVQGRELRLFRDLVRDYVNSDVIAKIAIPDRVFAFFDEEDRVKPLQLAPLTDKFQRYDDISEGDTQYRLDIRNLRNLFRGISILALFIGLLSFFFGLSHLFDDLFVLCQLIFVHLFIQSAWLPATFKIPVSGMSNVQFMAWLPYQGRRQIQNGIYGSDHYQRSPLVYEQYWKDISFLRAIYHTLIFLAVMILFYLIIRVTKAIVRPRLHEIAESRKSTPKFIERYYFDIIRRKFTYIDRIVRFSFFTAIWAANLQFIYFDSLPQSLSAGNQAVCIIVFVAYVLFPIVGQVYLWRESGSLNEGTFFLKHQGVRIRKQRILYYFWQYLKWLIIGILIAQLYNVNPLAVLIPLIFIHLLDGVLVLVAKPYIMSEGEEDKIVSRCTKLYWKKYYWISFVIQNFLFLILEVIIIIMHGIKLKATREEYLSAGYAACAFVILLLANGLIRVAWGFVKTFEICVQDTRQLEEEVKSEDQRAPLERLFDDPGRGADLPDDYDDRKYDKRPSIVQRINN